MNTTTNLGLKKPELSERYSLAVWNDNSDTLDTFAGTVNTALAGKADASTTYTKTEVNTALAGKADASTTYTKTEVDTALSGKQDALSFDATPAADSDNPVKSKGIKTYVDDAAASYFKKGTLIPDNSNFNSYDQLGIFYVANNDSASTMTNKPASYGGRLEVFATIDDDTYVKQTYYTNTDEGRIYSRRKLSSGWSAWEELARVSQVKLLALGMGTSKQTSQTVTSFNLDTDFREVGRFSFGATVSKVTTPLPFSVGTAGVGFELIVERIQLDRFYRQTIIQSSPSNIGKFWVRISSGNSESSLSWSSWYLFEGTAVT